MNRTFEALFKEADDGLLLEAIYDAIEEAWGPCVEEGMSPEVRTFLLVYSACGHASCGGLKCLLHDSAHDLGETIGAFAEVGLAESADTLRRFAAAFPNGAVPDESLSAEQAEFFEDSGPLFHSDVVPELATWVRARPKAFLGLPTSSFSNRFKLPPTLPLPAANAASREVGEWLHRRGVKLEFAEHRYENGVPITLYASHGIPEGALTLIGVVLPYDRRDITETLEALSIWIGRGGIQQIDLADARLGPEALATLARFSSLRRLGLRGAHFTDSDLRLLVGVDALEELNLSGTSVMDEGLAPLAALPALRSMKLLSTRVRGATLGKFHGLTELTVGHSPIEDGALSFLETLAGLTTFGVLKVTLQAKAMERVASLRNLHALQLWDNGLSEQALQVLQGHPTLKSLNLSGMKLTKSAAEILAKIPRLETLRIGDVEKPQEMIDRLLALRPEIEI